MNICVEVGLPKAPNPVGLSYMYYTFQGVYEAREHLRRYNFEPHMTIRIFYEGATYIFKSRADAVKRLNAYIDGGVEFL